MACNLGLRPFGYVASVMASRACDRRGISQRGLMEFRVQERRIVQRRVGRRSARAGMACPAIRRSRYRYMVRPLGLGILRHKTSVMAGRAVTGRGIPYRGCVECHSQERRKRLGRRIRMAARASIHIRSGWCGDMDRLVDRDNARVLSFMARRARGARRMGIHGTQECRVTDMACIAIRRVRSQGDVSQRGITDHVGENTDRTGLTCRTAMALETIAYESVSQVIDLVTHESAGVLVAVGTRLLCREVICRFAHDTEGLPIVTRLALTGYRDMAEALYQEAGSTDMAGITRERRGNMIDRFREGSDPCSGVVAASTVFGCVLEYSIDVTLFALQRRMDLPEYKSCFRVIEGAVDCHGLR